MSKKEKSVLETFTFKKGFFIFKVFSNESKGIVTCKVIGVSPNSFFPFVDTIGQECENNDYVGIAKLHPNDKFDIKKGISFASRRALRKLHGSVRNELNRLLRGVDTTFTTTISLVDPLWVNPNQNIKPKVVHKTPKTTVTEIPKEIEA